MKTVGWETRSRTSIYGVRVALRQEVKSIARRIKTPEILRKVGTEMMTGSPWGLEKDSDLSQNPHRKHTGRGAESMLPSLYFFQ